MGTTRKGWQGEKKASGQHRSVLWTDSISLNKYRRAANGLNLTSGPVVRVICRDIYPWGQTEWVLQPLQFDFLRLLSYFSICSLLLILSLPPLYAPSLLFPLAFHSCCVCLVDVWQCLSEAPSTVRPCLNSGRKRDIKYGPVLHYYVIITIHNPCSHLPAKKFESWQKLSFSYHLNASLFLFTPAPAFDWFHNYLMTILTLIPPP